MTKAELIALLEDVPDDAVIKISQWDGDAHYYKVLGLGDIDFYINEIYLG